MLINTKEQKNKPKRMVKDGKNNTNNKGQNFRDRAEGFTKHEE